MGPNKKAVLVIGRKYGLVYATLVFLGGVSLAFPLGSDAAAAVLLILMVTGGFMAMALYSGMDTHMESASYGGKMAYEGDLDNLQVSKLPTLYKAGMFGLFLSVESLIGLMILKATVGI